MSNMVLVDPETFRSVLFMTSEPRREFVADRGVRNEDKPQKRTRDGIPVWSVTAAVTNWRNQSSMIAVTVPMHSDPATKFQGGDRVEFAGLVFGVSPKQNGGFSVWCSADDLVPAGSYTSATTA